ncbi:YCF48-related protein [Shivajiella indica]|uniref:YCF48-related protein n=1 Tax=Shivajiella indica TaxID=872115 RepID=A0ABW5B2D6_9BACT
MRHHLYLTFLFLFFFSVLEAQTWRRLGGWGNQFTGIVWVNEEVGYISGNQIILKSLDGGLSWFEQEAPDKVRMLSVDFFNETLGLMVGENGNIFRTTNGGANWQLLNIGADIRLNKVKFLNGTRAYIVGDNGEVYRSTNAGQTWSKQNVGTLDDLKSLYFFNADTGYVTTSAGEIIRTFNGGNNWSIKTTGQTNGLNDTYFVTSQVGYAVGQKGTIIKTLDAGETWSEITSGTERDLFAVAFNRSNPNLGVVTGQNATLLRTLNAGTTFDAINVNNQQNYVDAGFRANANVVFAVGTNGFLLTSNNSGGSWGLRLSGREIDYQGTQFRTATLGYIIGENGSFFVTSNGGNSLVDRSRPLSNTFNDLFFTTNAFGYVCGNGGVILRTTNSGVNWSSLNPGTNVNINGLYFFNNNLGYAVGDSGFLTKTENGGVNWESISIGNTNFNFSKIAFFNEESGIIIGSSGFVAILDNGEWKKISINITEDINAISILDENSAVIVGKSGTIFKTIDKGVSWSRINLAYNQNFNDVTFLDEQVGFVAGEKGLMIQTKDGGESWEQLTTATFQDFTGISFGTLSNGFAVGENGTLFSYDCQVPEQPTLIFGENNVCLSQQVYTVQEPIGLEVEFEWRVDGGRILEGQGSSRIVVEWDIPGRNAVLVRGKNFCGNSGTTGLEVIVSTTPQTIGEIEGEGAVCVNTEEVYAVPDIPGTIFVWEVMGGEILEGQGESQIKVRWTGTTQSNVQVTPNNPCGQGQTFTKEIVVQSPPSKPSDISGPVMVGFTEEIYEITSVPEVNFQWTISGQGGRVLEGQGSNRITVIWEREGDFTITVTPMNGCNEGESNELSVNVNIITSIDEEIFQEENIKVYPNPSSGDFKINIQGITTIQQIRIVNAFGQTLNQVIPEIGINDYQFRNLPQGYYNIIIQTREKEYIKKVLVR